MIRFASFTFSSFLFIPFAVLSLLYFFLYGAPGRLTAFRSIRQTFIRYAHKFRHRAQEKFTPSLHECYAVPFRAGFALHPLWPFSQANSQHFIPPFLHIHSVHSLTSLAFADPNPNSKHLTIMASKTLIVLKSWQHSKAALTQCRLQVTIGVHLTGLIYILRQVRNSRRALTAIITASITGRMWILTLHRRHHLSLTICMNDSVLCFGLKG